MPTPEPTAAQDQESGEPIYVDGIGYRLPMEPRTQRYGCGVYEVGENGCRMFVTDTGRVLPLQGRIMDGEQLMEVYVWGRLDAEAARRGFIPPDPDERYADDDE